MGMHLFPGFMSLHQIVLNVLPISTLSICCHSKLQGSFLRRQTDSSVRTSKQLLITPVVRNPQLVFLPDTLVLRREGMFHAGSNRFIFVPISCFPLIFSTDPLLCECRFTTHIRIVLFCTFPDALLFVSTAIYSFVLRGCIRLSSLNVPFAIDYVNFSSHCFRWT